MDSTNCHHTDATVFTDVLQYSYDQIKRKTPLGKMFLRLLIAMFARPEFPIKYVNGEWVIRGAQLDVQLKDELSEYCVDVSGKGHDPIAIAFPCGKRSRDPLVLDFLRILRNAYAHRGERQADLEEDGFPDLAEFFGRNTRFYELLEKALPVEFLQGFKACWNLAIEDVQKRELKMYAPHNVVVFVLRKY